jgi:hypothetical protein
MWPRYLIGVRPRPGHRGDWRAAVRDRLATQGAAPFGVDDELVDVSGDPMGVYRFVELDEASHDFAGAPWLARDHRCPFVGPLAGFVAWEWWYGYHSFGDRRYLIDHLLAATDGVIVRTDTGAFFDPIIEAECTLAQVVQKHGFEGGAFFLRDVDHDADYGAYVRDTITAALRAIDLRGDFITYGTSHNRIRIDDFQPRRGETHAACWERFRIHDHHSVRLWGIDCPGLRSPAFRALLDDDASPMPTTA